MKQYLTPIIRFCEGECVELLSRALTSLLSVEARIANIVLMHTNGSGFHSIEDKIPDSLHGRIDYIPIKSNKDSRSMALIKSKSAIKGLYVIFLDYDDEIDCRSTCIIDNYELVSNYQLVFGSYSYLYYQFEFNKHVLKSLVPQEMLPLTRKSYCLKNSSPMGSFLIAKDLFIKAHIEESLIYQEDYYLLLCLLRLVGDHDIMFTSVHFLRCWRNLAITHAEKYKSDCLHSMSFINQKKMELLLEK